MTATRFALIGLMAACSCATAGTTDPPASWCLRERYDVELSEHRDVEFRPVRSDRMMAAVDALRDDSALALTPQRVAEFLGTAPSDGPGRYYLVRAAVYAPAGATVEQLVQASGTASYHLWYRGPDHALVAVAQPVTGAEDLLARNVAMILRANVPLQRVVVACYAIR